MSKRNNFFGSKTSYTARTTAFLAATGITDTTIANALNTMDLALIAAGFLPSGTGAGKIEALYPYVGGTATTHKFNFVNPADTDAAYRIVWSGGVTHDVNGITGNGSNGYGQTYWALNAGNLYNRSWSCYLRTMSSENKWSGYFDGSRVFGVQLNSTISPKRTSTHGLNGLSSTTKIYNYGLFAASIPSNAANAAFYFNINSVIFNVTAGASPTTSTMPTLGMPVIFQYTSRNLAFEHYGQGLTSAELSTLSGIVTTFQTSLGRNV